VSSFFTGGHWGVEVEWFVQGCTVRGWRHDCPSDWEQHEDRDYVLLHPFQQIRDHNGQDWPGLLCPPHLSAWSRNRPYSGLCLKSGLGPRSWLNHSGHNFCSSQLELVPQKCAHWAEKNLIFGDGASVGMRVRMSVFAQSLSQGTWLPEPGVVLPNELGISFCPQPTSLLPANPNRSLWNLATHRKQWKLGFLFSSLHHYSKGFP
jgi:hypothetical protein